VELKKYRKKLKGFKKTRLFLVVVGMFIGVTVLLKNAGNYLDVNENPKKSDVIIVLSGGRIDRLEKGVELYNQGQAPFLMISNGSEERLYETALKMGVPSKSIILEKDAKSTTENAILTIDLMEKHNLQSAIVVSSNYHMRRVKSNYDKANKYKGLDIIYCSAVDIIYKPNNWWKTKENRIITIGEYFKMIGNYLGIHGEKAKKILEVLTSKYSALIL
jgi:vancomycin permeability regulator SanA